MLRRRRVGGGGGGISIPNGRRFASLAEFNTWSATATPTEGDVAQAGGSFLRYQGGKWEAGAVSGLTAESFARLSVVPTVAWDCEATGVTEAVAGLRSHFGLYGMEESNIKHDTARNGLYWYTFHRSEDWGRPLAGSTILSKQTVKSFTIKVAFKSDKSYLMYLGVYRYNPDAGGPGVGGPDGSAIFNGSDGSNTSSTFDFYKGGTLLEQVEGEAVRAFSVELPDAARILVTLHGYQGYSSDGKSPMRIRSLVLGIPQM